MVRAIVLYEQEPDAERYVEHAEWEWPDMESFKSAARSDEFMATGKDAMEMGGKLSVMFAEVD